MNRVAAAGVAATLLAVGLLFQLALVAGLPWGEWAWGGRFAGVLPVAWRWASLATTPILGLAIWVVLVRAKVLTPGFRPAWMHRACWAYAVYFGVNALGNLASQSRYEQWAMTPLALILMVCFGLVARGRSAD